MCTDSGRLMVGGMELGLLRHHHGAIGATNMIHLDNTTRTAHCEAIADDLGYVNFMKLGVAGFHNDSAKRLHHIDVV